MIDAISVGNEVIRRCDVSETILNLFSDDPWLAHPAVELLADPRLLRDAGVWMAGDGRFFLVLEYFNPQRQAFASGSPLELRPPAPGEIAALEQLEEDFPSIISARAISRREAYELIVLSHMPPEFFEDAGVGEAS